MKQQEKTRRTREHILSVAMEEFGTKSYETASINNICSTGGISKGLLYHNFKNKDELYLQCVKESYDQMIRHLKAEGLSTGEVSGSFRRLLQLRQEFFLNHPYYANIFFQSVLQPPKHLTGGLKSIRREFDDFCTETYRGMLSRLSLREGITEEMALEYFSAFTEMFNRYFQSRAEEGGDYHTLIEDHEGKLPAIWDMMIYGVAQQN